MSSTSDPQLPQLTQQPFPKPAIVINGASKRFTLKHANTFKEAFLTLVRRQALSTSFNAVDNLTLEVPVGQSIAILGRNGSGKSTTLKLLSGVMKPDSGWVRIRGRVAGLLEVGAGFNPNLTGRENVYLNAAILGMSRRETDARFEEILEFSEIGDFIDTEVKHYSSGMYARLGFSVAVHTELDVLLVDEVLSVGDAAFKKKCSLRMQEMRASGKTLFIVSHSASQVRQLCDRGVVLDEGKLVFDGSIEDALQTMENAGGFRTRSLRSQRKTKFDALIEIDEYLDKHPLDYGVPVGEATHVTENGGGVVQRCTEGMITASESLKVAQGLRSGAFLRAYEAAGGPRGAWGFISGRVQHVGDSGRRQLQFQNGTANFVPGEDVLFEKHQ